jgi:ribonuclease D
MTDTANNNSIEFEYIDTQAALETLMHRLKTVDEVALDTEADSFHHYEPKICLIQLKFDEQTYLIDPLARMNLDVFLAELAQKKLIIHDAGYDLRMMNAGFGFKPQKPVFDTMLGASLAGLESVGLSGLLHHMYDRKVAKHNQKADWSRRPLPANLLNYAAEDTNDLLEIKQYLKGKLEGLDRLTWHEESCQWAVRAAYAPKEPVDPDRLWRIKGSGKLSPKERAFLREIWHWRDAIARRTNLAPFMILNNPSLTKLAHWGAHRKKKIADNIILPIRCKPQNMKPLIKTLQKAQDIPADEWPGPVKSDPSKKLSNATRKMVDKLKNECQKVAEEINLAPQLIASRSALTRIVLNKATTLPQIQKKKILMNWQADLLLPTIKRVLDESTE